MLNLNAPVFAGYNWNEAQMLLFFFFYMKENIVEKGENVGYQHFLLLP